jgi:hypothetical protein
MHEVSEPICNIKYLFFFKAMSSQMLLMNDIKIIYKKKSQKKFHFLPKKVSPFLSKKVTHFFCSKIAKFHFFSVLESPAYISANRVGNFFYIEKRHFFHKNSIKFPTHFPDRYVECQYFQGPKLL